MTVHKVTDEDNVVVFIEGLGHVNVHALKKVFEEVELQESLSVQNDYDRGCKSAIYHIHKALLSHVVKDVDENTVTAENAAAAQIWDDGEKAGVENQMNWDGWRMSRPRINNPYEGA